MYRFQDLKGKRVLITGSTKGIGLDIAKKFYDYESFVILNGRSKNNIEKLKKIMPKALFFKGDVSKIEEAKKIIKRIIKKLGGLDILICNVGNGNSVPPGKENVDEFKRMLDINFFSAVNMIQSCEGQLAKSNGSIVCISSICGIEAIPGAPIAYSVAKSTLNSYVKLISRSIASKNIRINAITPGNILFKGSTWDKKIKLNSAKVKKMINEEVPLKKIGNTNDISSLVLYLASNNANFITGSIWTVDGGQTRSL